MMEFKGTKGEWKITDEDDTRICINGVGIDVWGFHPVIEQEMKANAKLIAAAPELLEALQGLLNDFKEYVGNHGDELIQCGYVDVCEQAIKKAL